jgi:glycosyltransferase involved in cell wall biosynthesis
MGSALPNATANLMNTPEATREVRRHFPGLRDKPVVTIPNGFDAADFPGPAPERNDGVLRIVHAGYVHVREEPAHRWAMGARQLLGGAVKGLEIGTRSHVYLLRAVRRVLAERPELARRIEVHLAGLLSDADRRVFGFEVVHEHGYLPHDETVELLRTADLLFLPMHDLPPGRRARIVPGKTYEYLASRRPILAAVPDGDVRDLLSRAGNAFVCRPDDDAAMARVISEQADRVLAGRPAPAPREDVLAEFERRRLSERLVEVFDVVLGGEAEPSAAVAASAES